MGCSLQAFYDDVMKNGATVFPRGMMALALENTTFDCVPGEVFTRPGMNMDIGFIELLQWIAGTFSIKPFERHAPKAHLELFTWMMAYGPRTKNQMQYVIDELNNDPDTRRAALIIANIEDKPVDLPCTLNMQFQLNKHSERVRTLHTTVNMRSNDLVWGTPTDIIQFGGIAQMIAACTHSIATEMVINCGNSHIYWSTQMKEGEHFSLSGTFSLPVLYTLQSFRDWAEKSLNLIESGITKPRYVCEYVPNVESGTIETTPQA